VNIKMNDFIGNILQNKFYACCYILLSGTPPKRRCTHTCLQRCYLGAAGAKTTLLLTAYCIEYKGAARGGAEGAQAPPLAIRILMFIS